LRELQRREPQPVSDGQVISGGQIGQGTAELRGGSTLIEASGILRGDEFVTSDALTERTRRAASALRSVGVGPGDTVALLLRNDHPYFEAAYAAGVVGAAPVPVNWHGTPDEILYVLHDCRAKVLVAHADLVAPLVDLLPRGLEVRVVATPADISDTYGIPRGAGVVPDGAIEWSAWVGGFEAWTEAPRGAPAAMTYTSGTTGKPKGVRRGAVEEVSPYIVALSQVMGTEPGLRAVVTGPMYHSGPYGWAMSWGRANGLVVLQPRFDPEDLLRIIETERISHLLLVPIMFTRLLQLPAGVRDSYDLSSLRYISHGAAPCPRRVKVEMIELCGPIIHELYGSTESGILTAATSEEWLDHPGTVGRPLTGVELKIVGEDGGEVPVGQAGEIYSRITGYPDFTYEGRSDARAEIERDGFVTSGDVGYVDHDGFLYLCDRKKDMVISGGVNIYPIEIEECILGLAGVRDVAVFGVPDDEYGEALAAAVQLADGASLTADDVRTHVRANLAAFKTPRVVEFHDELPREDSGKVFKRRLRDPFWAASGRAI
jgi:long-chain acyl-CoA synthetase